ncbi:MAG: type II toxin-antitoxin system ParD family antitoxin [Cyanobacteria bacterium SBLK]|nr:type II toxin-antitoxin system ParD family antitoxin [Cyanobacteria bacterium SBLK]
MQITLSPEQTRLLELLSRNGGYASMEDAIDTALGLLADEVSLQDTEANPEYLAWVEQTRLKVEEGLAQSKRGEVLEGEVVIARLRDKVRSRRISEQEAQVRSVLLLQWVRVGIWRRFPIIF